MTWRTATRLPSAAVSLPESYAAALDRRPGSLQIACLTERADGSRVSGEVEAAVQEAQSLLLDEKAILARAAEYRVKISASLK